MTFIRVALAASWGALFLGVLCKARCQVVYQSFIELGWAPEVGHFQLRVRFVVELLLLYKTYFFQKALRVQCRVISFYLRGVVPEDVLFLGQHHFLCRWNHHHLGHLVSVRICSIHYSLLVACVKGQVFEPVYVLVLLLVYY